VAFGREVDDRIVLGNQLIHELGVTDVTMHEGVVGEAFLGPQAFPIARIGEQIEVGHAPVRMFRQNELDGVGTDETAAASDEDLHGMGMYKMNTPIKIFFNKRHHTAYYANDNISTYQVFDQSKRNVTHTDFQDRRRISHRSQREPFQRKGPSQENQSA